MPGNPNAINPREGMKEYAQRRLEQLLAESENCAWMAEELLAMYQFTWMRERMRALVEAAQRIRLTPHIRKYLEAHDPKALQQLEIAVDNLEGKD